MRRWTRNWLLPCLLLMFAFSTEAYTTQDLLRMTQESLYADWQENVAHVRGVGRIEREGVQGVLLARRAALADAGRGLLLLRQQLLSSGHWQRRISGHVPPLRLLSESVRDGLYFVEVEASLSSLLSKNGRKSLSGIQSLRLEED